MHQFSFRLETLLKYRRTQEEQSQIRLAQASAEYLHEQEILLALNNRLSEHLDIFRSKQHETVTVATLKMFQEYHDRIIRDLDFQQNKVTFAAARRQECLTALEDAVKARKLVEKLREKRLLQYQTEMLQEEQKHLDELGLQVFTRNS